MKTEKPDDVLPDPYPEFAGRSRTTVAAWGAGWLRKKHCYLVRYLDATREAQKKFKQRVLIDPFSGPGRIQVEGESFTRDGGSVAAYCQSVRSGAPFTKLLVGDIDADRAHANERRLKAVGANVQSFVGPAKQTVDEMARAVPSGP